MISNSVESVTNLEDKQLPWRVKIGFGFYQLANVGDFMITTWLMYYYTTFLGMSIMLATMIFTVGKIIGSAVTPIYGFVSDRLYQTKFGRRFGRRKSLMIIAIPLKVIFFIFLWIPGLGSIAYFILFMLYYLVYPMLQTTQLTFMSEMTQNPGQRAQLAGINQAGGTISGVIASMFIIYLFKIFGQNQQSTYFICAMIYNAMMAMFLVVFYFSVSERPYDSSTDLKDVSTNLHHGNIVKQIMEVFWNLISVFRVKSFVIYFGMYISEQLFRSLRGTINTYFIVFALLLTPTSVASSTAIGYVFGVLFIIFFAWATKKTNGAVTYRIASYSAMAVLSVICAVAFIHPAHMVTWWIILITCLNFGIAGVVNAAQYTFSFIPDVDEMITSKRREGQYAGVQATLDVLFSTLESLLIGVGLSAVGFVSNANAQSTNTVHALVYMYTILPIILLAFGTFSSYFMKLDDKNHKILLDEVVRLRQGGSMKDVDPEIKAVIEKLTGFKYEDCWGHNKIMDFAHNTEE
jgi:oligogalacturonide transporter